MLGVMTLITVLSVMSGFHADLREKILGVNAHIVMLSLDGKIGDYNEASEKIRKLEGVEGSSPFIYGQVILRFRDRAHGVVIRGIDPDSGKETIGILNKLVAGKVQDLKRSRVKESKFDNSQYVPGIILGRELMKTLGVFAGDIIDMVSPVGEIGPLGMMPKMKKYRIVGYFDAGMYEYDSSLGFISIEDAQQFFNYGEKVSGIEVRISDLSKTKDIALQIQYELGSPYYARDWMEMNKNLFSALKLEKIAMFIILALIILVASFNIISNLIMTVMEKSREIAIMKAMGATNRGIMTIFMLHGLTIGLIGTVLGMTAGFLLCQLLKRYQFISLPGDVYYLSYLPVQFNTMDFILVPAAAILISFLATLYPSWQAAKLDPVEPLRYE